MYSSFDDYYSKPEEPLDVTLSFLFSETIHESEFSIFFFFFQSLKY